MKILYLTFRFPTRQELRHLWINSTGRIEWIPNKSSKICSQHFDTTNVIKRGNRTYLHPEAIPITVKL